MPGDDLEVRRVELPNTVLRERPLKSGKGGKLTCSKRRVEQYALNSVSGGLSQG